MRFRFTLSHAVEGSVEVNEPDGWKDVALKLERHEDFHSLIEHFSGSFILYGDNGTVNGGIDFVLLCERNHGPDTTILVDIDVTFDEETFSNVFNGQYSIIDLEHLPDNKMRIPIIRDDFWSKFIARLDTPVNIKDPFDLDDEFVGNTEEINIDLTSQIIEQNSVMHVQNSALYGGPLNIVETGEYLQIDWDTVTLDEVQKKYSIPIMENVELPAEQFEMEFDGVYQINCKLYFTNVSFFGSGGVGTFLAYTQLFNTNVLFLKNGSPVSGVSFVKSDHNVNVNGIDFGYSAFVLSTTLSLKKGDLISIVGLHSDADGWFVLLGKDSTGISDFLEEIDDVGTEIPDFPNGYTDDNGLTIVANTSYQETDGPGFLIHDVGAAICDRIIGQTNTFYSEYLGSQLTRARQYLSNGCAWAYGAIKGLQLRNYTLAEKPFFQSFNQWWKGLNPILNLSLSYETVQIPEFVDVSPDINMIQDLANWQNAPGATWDFATFSQPFISVNAGSNSGYAYGTFAAVADTVYAFDTTIIVDPEFGESPNVIVRWAILDAGFNEIDTIDFNYMGAGIKIEHFILIPPANGIYFAVKGFNNTPTATKNFQVTQAFSEAATIVYHEESVIRVEEKSRQYDDSQGTSVDFNHMRLTRKYDNDRIFNKIEIGYSRWQSENISSLDDPQTKKSYATRFQKIGKPIQIISEWIAASLAIEKTRRTTREKSADYQYDNETFIIALNPTEQAESPDVSPDIMHFIPELDENFSGIANIKNSDSRYNLKLTPGRNFKRWQNYVQGALQGYLGSFFKFVSGEGNYDFVSDLDSACVNEGGALDEKGDIMVDIDYLHLPELYEAEHHMEWSEYVQIRNAPRKPIGVSETDTGHIPMFIKSLEYHPAKGTCTFILLAKEHLELGRLADTTPMQECMQTSLPEAQSCENAITDEFGQYLFDEFGECITADEEESLGSAFDFPFDSPF